MDQKIIEGLMNPVRIQIVLYLLRNETCTTKELGAALPDVPTASLYRHVRRLRNDGIIAVNDTTQIRGAVEKEYILVVNPYEQMDKAVEEGDKDSLMVLFYQFAMTRMLEFNKYLEKSEADIVADKVGFRTYPLYLTEAETDQFRAELNALIERGLQNRSSPERQLRSFSFIFMPAQDTTNS